MSNFDLKKYLIENKATVNSKILKEVEEDNAPENYTNKISRDELINNYLKGQEALQDQIRTQLVGKEVTFSPRSWTQGSELKPITGTVEDAKFRINRDRYQISIKLKGGSRYYDVDYYSEETTPFGKGGYIYVL
jgi:hypothetical protein